MRIVVDREVGIISNFGGTMLQGHFFTKKEKQSEKVKRVLYCFLQNLEGRCLW